MSETAQLYPSGRPSQGPKLNLTKEVLEKVIDGIRNLSQEEIIGRLEGYKDVSLGKNITEETNTFEMIALYQRALALLGYNVTIDGRFGKGLYSILKEKVQKELGLKGSDVDGFPGSKTTKVLVEKLQETIKIQERTNVRKYSDDIKPILAKLNDTKDFNPTLSQNGNKIIGKSIDTVEYALITQSNGNSIIYDKIRNDSRFVYLINNDSKVLARVSIDKAGNITGEADEKSKMPNRIPFQPEFSVTTK